MGSILKNTVGIWLILTIAFLPFPYFLFQSFFSHSSDSISSYYIAGIGLLFSISISILQYIFKLIKQEILDQLIYTSVAYILSYFLLKYGLDKLLLRQFYTPEPNILFTPVGALTKDILFWSTMGTSKIYNVFMGLIEIVPGLLLLHHKTRVFGAICAFGVLLNVFMINVGFDISVKLLSLYLLISAMYLFQPVFWQLINLFMKQKAISAIKSPHLSFTNNRIKRILKATVIALILLDVALPYLEEKSVNELHLESCIGSYEAKTEALNLLGFQVKRIHIHSKGYFIIEDVDSKFHDFKISVIGNSIHLLKENISLEIDKKEEDISFQDMKFTKIDSNSIPLLKDEFHWTTEGIINNLANP